MDFPAIGARVDINGVHGIVRFYGTTSFAPGKWVGVELDAPAGKNDGSVNAIRYFDAGGPNRGVFVRSAQVKLVTADASKSIEGTALSRDGSSLSTASAASSVGRDLTAKAALSGSTSARPPASSKIKASIIKPPQPGSTPNRLSNAPTSPTHGSATSETLSSSPDRKAAFTPPSPVTSMSSSPSRLKPRAVLSSHSHLGVTSRSSAVGTSRSTATHGTTVSRPASPALSSLDVSAVSSPRTVPSLPPNQGLVDSPSTLVLPSRLGEMRLEVADFNANTDLLDEAPPDEFDSAFATGDDDFDIYTSQKADLSMPSHSTLVAVSSSAAGPFTSCIKSNSQTNSAVTIDAVKPLGLPAKDAAAFQKAESSVSISLVESPTVFETLAPSSRGDSLLSSSLKLGQSLLSSAQRDIPSLPASDTSTPPKMVPLRELQDLKIKLRVLESKRNGERELNKQNEKLKAEIESAQIMRTRLSERLEQLQDEVNDSRRLLKEAAEKQQNAEKQVIELSEAVESMTLDKEVAEEKTEALQAEVEALKEKVEELTLDLEVMKEEATVIHEPASEPADTQGSARPAFEVVQLERQNERLKEALVKLRDVTSAQEAETKLRAQKLEHDVAELAEYKDLYHAKSNEVGIARSAIEDLKLQLDAASDASSVVDRLTERNLQLNERIEELLATVADLEALKEVNDEIEENHLETERQLQAEIDLKASLLQELCRKIKAQEESMADYERTISQFRILVASQQRDIERLQASSMSPDSQNLSSQTQAMISLSLKLQSSAVKAQAKSIEMELRRLEVTQAVENLDIVRVYLPEAFARSEALPASTFLLFRRIAFKAKLVSQYVADADVTTLSFSAPALKQKGCRLAILATRFATYMRSCSADAYSHIGRCHDDVVAVEKRLDVVIELLKQRHLERPEVLMDIQRSVTYLEHLAEKELLNEMTMPICVHQFALACSKSLEANLERMDGELSKLQQVTAPSDLIEDTEWRKVVLEAVIEYNKCWEKIQRQNNSLRVVCKKLVKHFMSLTNTSKSVSSEFARELQGLARSSEQIVECFALIVTAIERYVGDCTQRREIFGLDDLSRISGSIVESMLGSPERVAGSVISNHLDAITGKVSELEVTSITGDLVTLPSPPWILRAEDLKKDTASSSQFENRVAILNEEIQSLAFQVKAKEQYLAEAGVRIEILEKRIELLQKQNETSRQLKAELARAQEQYKASEEVLDNVVAELKMLEEENETLKQLTQSRSPSNIKGIQQPRTMSLVNSRNQPGIQMAGPSSKGSKALDPNVCSQVEALQAALRYLRAENTRLKSKASLQATSLLFAPHDPLMRRQILGKSSSLMDTDDRLRVVALESRILARDAARIGCEPRLVDVARAKSLDGKKKWMPIAAEPLLQYHEQRMKMQRISRRGLELRERVRKIADSYGLPLLNKGVRVPASQPSSPLLLGRVSIPADDGNLIPQRHKLLITTHEDFEKLHSIFVS
ncbi:hypothetical protein SeMB42_g03157 [Synchytrium endobioticum]|nr:hypothetical protein SeMB42_g03157 [Synchytrium endobioticum]